MPHVKELIECALICERTYYHSKLLTSIYLKHNLGPALHFLCIMVYGINSSVFEPFMDYVQCEAGTTIQKNCCFDNFCPATSNLNMSSSF